jgi:hypothetical protein
LPWTRPAPRRRASCGYAAGFPGRSWPVPRRKAWSGAAASSGPSSSVFSSLPPWQAGGCAATTLRNPARPSFPVSPFPRRDSPGR